MDNFAFDIRSEGDMRAAMQVAFTGAPGATAVAWQVQERSEGRDRPRMIFAWSQSAGPDFFPLPVAMDADSVAQTAMTWLDALPADQWPDDAPDHDGDNGHGWRIYNEMWGHVGSSPYAFVAVEPAWAWHGK